LKFIESCFFAINGITESTKPSESELGEYALSINKESDNQLFEDSELELAEP
jgi:hypothetical protein